MAAHDKLAIAIAFGLTSLSTIVVALRFYCRYGLVGKLSAADWMMLTALIATWAFAVVNYYQVKYLNYTVIHDEPSYKSVITGSLLSFYIFRLSYLLDHCLIKLSILLFYAHISAIRTSYRRFITLLIATVLAASIGMFVAAILACNPPADAWSYDVFLNGIYGIHATQCYNPLMLWYFSAAWNLFTDTVIWSLPIPFVLGLQRMSRRRKLELVGIFSIGMLAVAASAVRLWMLSRWASSWEEQGQNTGNLLIWGQVEQHAGIIAASIPFLTPLARNLFRSGRREVGVVGSPAGNVRLVQQQEQEQEQVFKGRLGVLPSPAPTYGSEKDGEGGFEERMRGLAPSEPVSARQQLGSGRTAV